MQYKEHFKNKIYIVPISYDELNTLFDDYFALGLKDKEQMETLKDSGTVAEQYFDEVMNYGTENKTQSN